MRRLARDLRRERWTPSDWLQVPYPKRGACLRHYTMPSVRDQVAFMAFLVLLGPLLDRQFENFVFGNRWYRPIRWERRTGRGHWVQGPYPLLTDKAYLPYARSHGLYRRVAHWTVARMTNARIRDHDYGGPLQLPDDYVRTSLPEWTREEWWATEDRGARCAYWAALDLQLAYPSIRLSRLRESIRQMAGQAPVFELSGFPEAVLDIMARPGTPELLGDHLADALDAVTVLSGEIPETAWRPCCAAPDLPPDNRGLPTGLAISGLLMNVLLHAGDSELLTSLEAREGRDRSAFLRFADDMYVLSRSANGLVDLIDDVWRALVGEDSVALASGVSPSNLYLNLGKVAPEELSKLVNAYLKAQGWKCCGSCRRLRPQGSATETEVPTLGDWFRSEGGDGSSWGVDLQRTAVGPNEVGPFLTTLVSRLSELGTDTLAERFGEGARHRLGRLHELARFDIDDKQVRPETRRAFAANRLVRTWLSPDGAKARATLADIRESIAYVLRVTPWKFSLWRSVVRAAAMRPPERSEEDERLARDWLVGRLRHIAHVQGGQDSRSWMNAWPEDLEDEDRSDRDALWKALYLSFHRAAFWHAMGDVLRELWRHDDRVKQPPVGDAGPSPSWWTVRALPGGGHAVVAAWLGALDEWTGVLYPSEDVTDRLRRWPWELDELVAAVLASSARPEVAEGLRRAERPGGSLAAPVALISGRWRRTAELLEKAERVLPPHAKERALNESALAHLYLAGRRKGLAPVLFPAGQPPRILGAPRDTDHAIAVGMALGCGASIGLDLLRQALLDPAVAARKASRDPHALREYGRARRLYLGHEVQA